MSRGLLFILISMASIGVSVPIGGIMMEKFPQWLFAFITIVIAALVLFPIAKIYEKTKLTKLGMKNYGSIFIQALLTVTLYTVFQLYGLTHASIISVGIITSITPAVVAILALILLRERFTIKKGVAVTLAIIAVLIMEVAGVEIEGGSGGLGILFMLLAVTSMALFFIYAKKFTADNDIPPFTLASVLCFFGAIQTLPMAIYQFNSIDPTLFTSGANWLGILGYTLAAWVFAYAFTYLGIPRINASTAGLATAAIPIVATLVALIAFQESMRMVDIIALILVVATIFIAESEERHKNELNNVPPIPETASNEPIQK